MRPAAVSADGSDQPSAGSAAAFAIRLMSRVGRDLGVRLELADLLGASTIETLVCVGIWALGALIFTLTTRVALAIERGELRASQS